MTPEDFDALFDRFERTVVRLEAGLSYSVGGLEQKRIDAWKVGEPRPERSVRTSPWLARIARQTITEGKSWRRLRIADQMNDYLRFQLTGYAESQAAGDEIRLLPREELRWPYVDDFWLFDGGTRKAFAVFLHYTDAGELESIDPVDAGDRETLDDLQRMIDTFWPEAVPLNQFLAAVAHHG